MDTSEPTAPVPDEPTARIDPPVASPSQTGEPVPEPTAPIALGPIAAGWPPPSTPSAPPPAPPAPPMAPPSAPPTGPPAPPLPPTSGAGAGAWGPISTPYGLAWGPTPIPPVPVAARNHPRLVALTTGVVALSMLVGVAVGYAVWRPTTSPTTNVAANGGNSSGLGSSGLGSSGLGSSGLGSSGSGSSGSGSSGSSGSGSSGSGSGGVADPSSVAAKVDPGLVDINVTLSYEQESAAGTGQVLTSSGEVLTNNHVIDGATSITAVDIGNGRQYTASVVGYDRTGDLAVLQLHGASGLSTVTIGDSSKVTVGQPIVAIGNAGGVGGSPSVANGMVTTLNQAITASDDNGGNSEQLTGLIEVNANVEPGDSGGPLVNSAGDVVGIDTAASQSNTFSSSSGDGYAIPINTAISIARQIEAGKSSSTIHVGPTAFLGVVVESQSSGGFGGLGTGGSTVSGASVTEVASGSPAESAGLVAGDTITAAGGQPVTSPQSLSTVISGHSPGDSLQVTWVDAEGTSHTATVHLASGPAT